MNSDIKKTVVYDGDNKLPIRQEKRLTLSEYIKLDRLKSGQYILLGDLDEQGNTLNSSGFWVGHATPYHEPSVNDGGFGWDLNSNLCKKHVIEVHEFKF